MPKIKSLKAREILDSRGWPTLEAEIILENGIRASASVPSGLAVGKYESAELRDGDIKRYQGRGVLKAVSKINDLIAPALNNFEVIDQNGIDKKLIEIDGTTDKSNLGANTTLVVSFVCARAGAKSKNQELFQYISELYSFKDPSVPTPIFNFFNGGGHADTNLDFQEFLVIPKKSEAKEMIRQGADIFHTLGDILKEAGYDTDIGAEGGYAPDMDSSIDAMEFILAAGLKAGYEGGKNFWLGIDVGSTVLFEENSKRYVFPLDKTYFLADNLIGLYETWFKKYPIIYLEDGLAEDDWSNWQELTKELGKNMIIAGDDLFSTNANRLRQGIKERAGNAIIIKPNQVGTLTETIDSVKLANKHSYQVILSHRSGETNDDFLVDLAVAVKADYLKAGSLSRGERIAKYNRLMEIEEILKNGKH